MPIGSIWIAAALAEQAAPLAGVRVTVLDETGVVVARLETDENGTAVQTGLAAPDRSYSLDEGNTSVRPYAVYDLVAEKEGWQTVRLSGVQVFDAAETSRLVRRLNVLIGIIAVPKEAAQQVADELVEGGVRAIWNFAPANLVLPQGIAVKNEDMAASLAILSKRLAQILNSEK